MADRARAPSDTLLGDVRALGLAQTTRSIARAGRPPPPGGQPPDRALGPVLRVACCWASLTSFWTVRSVDRPLRHLIGAAERFGAGDLRPIQLGGGMPTEIERLARAMDDMGGRLRGVVVSVVSEASQIGNSASDFSAMSEELAASSGEISTAMVKIAASAEQQVSGMEKADALLVSLREIAEANAEASARVAELGDRIQELAARHRADVAAAGQTLLDVREVVRASADQVQELARLSRADHRLHRSHQADLVADQPAGPERRHRGRARRRARTRASPSWPKRFAGWPTRAPRRRRTWPRRSSSSGTRCSRSPAPWRSARPRCRASRAWRSRPPARWRRSRARWRRCTTRREAVAREVAANQAIVEQLGTGRREVSQSAGEHASASEEVTAAAEEQTASTEEMAAAAGRPASGRDPAHRADAGVQDLSAGRQTRNGAIRLAGGAVASWRCGRHRFLAPWPPSSPS